LAVREDFRHYRDGFVELLLGGPRTVQLELARQLNLQFGGGGLLGLLVRQNAQGNQQEDTGENRHIRWTHDTPVLSRSTFWFATGGSFVLVPRQHAFGPAQLRLAAHDATFEGQQAVSRYATLDGANVAFQIRQPCGQGALQFLEERAAL